MAKRQQAVPAQVRAGAGENTARVVVHKSVVPGWFWGVLGFVSVLAIGFGALLFAAKTGVFALGPSAPERSTTTAVALPAPAAAPQGAPQIEPLAPSAPAAPAAPVVEPRRRSASHPIKLARSPEPRRDVAVAPAAKPAAAASKTDAPVAKTDAPIADDAPVAKKTADKPAAADDDQVVHIHHATASDQDDDDDTSD